MLLLGPKSSREKVMDGGPGFPEVAPLLQRHKESTLRLPLSLRPLPPMPMSFTPSFLASHADSHLLNVVVHSLHAQAFVEHLLYILPTSQGLHHIQSPPVTYKERALQSDT